ncbi:MAG: 50S ribosomal protein L15 [Bacteroidetes bacterium RIFOXYA12_FULL_35_11]|nr:MAG: 50S ribosomal protein L15 [Bacteroidetes bacterium GWF2_35_48]OFY79580.1 MAG: 50S ribosomal protein L15 [Bacteroidetes bacterium RIFOXYA12_FULL_35_11]OFY93126.1 MAG: 50S ribosomal protein L15 [Bacteroidetes bacterium RIFOXYC12_FULL_35_7]OFY96088.1 MAG: 50S ribosomal protein L15 [Bacteroidetes bacterium RIFOXYB2_FULL_35_7]HBX50531.1 50S ribosomal protein L15 [Bacteroidales bacterium]
MNLHNLKPAEGSVKKEKKRVGRGQGSGKGATSTRGNKGAQARAGYERKIGHQGGQMPIQRTSPKFGFKNINRKEYKGINLKSLQFIAEKYNLTAIDPQVLADYGLISKKALIKILGNGSLTLKLEVKAHAFSKSAQQAIEALDGTVIKI